MDLLCPQIMILPSMDIPNNLELKECPSMIDVGVQTCKPKRNPQMTGKKPRGHKLKEYANAYRFAKDTLGYSEYFSPELSSVNDLLSHIRLHSKYTNFEDIPHHAKQKPVSKLKQISTSYRIARKHGFNKPYKRSTEYLNDLDAFISKLPSSMSENHSEPSPNELISI